MTLISSLIHVNFHANFIMENQLMDETSFLYEWQTAEEDLEFLDYTYCFEADNPNKGLSAGSKQTAGISLTDNIDHEKQTILNISLDKLRRIEDPESCLRRSVLINNTLKCIRSGLRMSDDDSTSCFAYPLPCKRMRLGDVASYNTTDNLKDPFEDYQEVIIRQDGNNDKETGSNAIDKVFCSSEVSSLARPGTKDAKRNCDTIRFTELEFPNVICPLET